MMIPLSSQRPRASAGLFTFTPMYSHKTISFCLRLLHICISASTALLLCKTWNLKAVSRLAAVCCLLFASSCLIFGTFPLCGLHKPLSYSLQALLQIAGSNLFKMQDMQYNATAKRI